MLKKGFLIVILGAAFVFAVGFVVNEQSMSVEQQKIEESQKNMDDEEQQKIEESQKIMDDMVSHHKGYFEQLPERTKQFMKENPDILRAYSKGNPIFMDVVSRYVHDVHLEPKDIEFLYDKLQNEGRDYFLKGEGPDTHLNSEIEEEIIKDN